MQNRIGLVGAALGWGQKYVGLSDAPQILRMSGLIKFLEMLNCRVTDYGDVKECNLRMPNLEDAEFGARYRLLSDFTHYISSHNSFCLTLGGDHSISLGSVHGLLKTHSDLGVLWVDAHGDINTPESSLSGNFHGMPVAGLLGEIKNWSGFEWLQQKLKPQKIAYIGLRDLDPSEEALIDKLGIQVYSMQMIRELGIEHVMKMALHSIDPAGRSPLHLSFDVDSVDPIFAPATGVPVPYGLTPYDVSEISTALVKTNRLVSMDIVEFNPYAACNADDISSTQDILYSLLDNVFSVSHRDVLFSRSGRHMNITNIRAGLT